MYRSGRVDCRGILAGRLEETPDGFRFAYDADYLADPDAPSISLTLPKRREPYTSSTLFPFFYGLLAEGVQKEIQCRQLRIDEADPFGRLLRTAGSDTIGAVTVAEEKEA